ncbi:MAG: DUF192 domain-containing protein [Polyangiales bacterium]
MEGGFAPLSFALALVAASLAAGCGCDRFARVVGPDDSERLHVCAEVAETEEERRRGLKDRDSLAEDEGLLIVFPAEGEVCIVNEGVPFPIDVVYAAEGGEVVAVERDIPAGDSTARCHAPVERVLEVNAGVASRVVPRDGDMPGDLLR